MWPLGSWVGRRLQTGPQLKLPILFSGNWKTMMNVWIRIDFVISGPSLVSLGRHRDKNRQAREQEGVKEEKGLQHLNMLSSSFFFFSSFIMQSAYIKSSVLNWKRFFALVGVEPDVLWISVITYLIINQMERIHFIHFTSVLGICHSLNSGRQCAAVIFVACRIVQSNQEIVTSVPSYRRFCDIYIYLFRR